ncbi:MAG: peptide deformylase [Pseudomonadota bacterium]
MLRQIVIHPDVRLKTVCDPVDSVDDGVRKLMTDMLETMYDAPGIGLAAPQVGVNARVIVMDCSPREKDADGNPAPAQPMMIANPEITWASDTLATYEEGCLSIPDYYADVARPEAVHVRWIDFNGAEQEADFSGIWAVCIQHEIDHLNGKLFIDMLSPMRRRLVTEKMKKLKRERARRAAEGAS